MTGTLKRGGPQRAEFAVLAGFFYAGYQWAVFASIARLAGVHVVGEYALALAVAAPVVVALSGRQRFIHGSAFEPRLGSTGHLKVWAAAGGVVFLTVAGTAPGGPFAASLSALLDIIARVK